MKNYLILLYVLLPKAADKHWSGQKIRLCETMLMIVFQILNAESILILEIQKF